MNIRANPIQSNPAILTHLRIPVMFFKQSMAWIINKQKPRTGGTLSNTRLAVGNRRGRKLPITRSARPRKPNVLRDMGILYGSGNQHLHKVIRSKTHYFCKKATYEGGFHKISVLCGPMETVLFMVTFTYAKLQNQRRQSQEVKNSKNNDFDFGHREISRFLACCLSPAIIKRTVARLLQHINGPKSL